MLNLELKAGTEIVFALPDGREVVIRRNPTRGSPGRPGARRELSIEAPRDVTISRRPVGSAGAGR